MNIYKNKTVQKINRAFPIGLMVVCALLFSANTLLSLFEVI